MGVPADGGGVVPPPLFDGLDFFEHANVAINIEHITIPETNKIFNERGTEFIIFIITIVL